MSAGKQQRKSDGKAQRNANTGKMRHNNATSSTCCCGGQPCFFCNIQSVSMSLVGAGASAEFPAVSGDYCLPFLGLIGPLHDRCQFGGICHINWTGGQSGRHYNRMSVGTPGIIRGTGGATLDHLVIPGNSVVTVDFVDDFNVVYGVFHGIISVAVIATLPGCDQHLATTQNGFSIDMVSNPSCTGNPLCTGPMCVAGSPLLCP